MKKFLLQLVPILLLITGCSGQSFKTLRAKDIIALEQAARGDDTLNLVNNASSLVTVNDTLLANWVGSKLDSASFGGGVIENLVLGESSTAGTTRTISAEGTETNIDINLVPKGSGSVFIGTTDIGSGIISTSSGNLVLDPAIAISTNSLLFINGSISPGGGSQLIGTTSNSFSQIAVNDVNLGDNTESGTTRTVTALGAGTDIDIDIVPKGAGQFLVNGSPVGGASSSGAANNINVSDGSGGFTATSLQLSGTTISNPSGNTQIDDITLTGSGILEANTGSQLTLQSVGAVGVYVPDRLDVDGSGVFTQNIASSSGDITITPAGGAGRIKSGTDGSPTAPAYSFSSESDLGMFRVGTNEIGFGAGNAERFAVSSSAVTINNTWTLPFSAGTDGQALVTNGSNSATFQDVVLSDGAPGSFTQVKTLTLEIGDWDMDATTSVTVAHGLSSIDQVTSMTATIIRDDASFVYPIDRRDSTLGEPSGQINLNSTNVVLERVASALFDGTNYNATSFNRGYITITYVD